LVEIGINITSASTKFEKLATQDAALANNGTITGDESFGDDGDDGDAEDDGDDNGDDDVDDGDEDDGGDDDLGDDGDGGIDTGFEDGDDEDGSDGLDDGSNDGEDDGSLPARKRQDSSDGTDGAIGGGDDGESSDGTDGADGGDDDSAPSPTDADAGMRLTGDMIESIFNEFNVLGGDDQKQWDRYINDLAPESKAYADGIALINGNFTGDLPPALNALEANILTNQIAPVQWISGVAGLLLLSLAAVMVVNGMSYNRYSSWSVICRILTGIVLLLLTSINNFPVASVNWVSTGWFLPTIVILYMLLFFADYIIAVLMSRNLNEQRKWTLPRVFTGAERPIPSSRMKKLPPSPFNPTTFPEGHRL